MAVSQKMTLADCLFEKGFLECFVVVDRYYNSIDKEIRLMFTQDMRFKICTTKVNIAVLVIISIKLFSN